MKNKKIVSLLFNDFTSDNRVLKENLSFKKAGYETLVVAIYEKGLKKKEIIKGIMVERLSINYIKLLPIRLIIFWIKSIVKYRKENIFHCNDLYALPIGVAIKIFFNKKAKIVYDCHEYETEAYIYKKKPILKLLAKFAENLLIRHADKVITVSKGIASSYRKMYGVNPVIVANCPPFKNYKKNNFFRKRMKISKDTKIILYQGRYKKGRGIETLINTFKKIKDDLGVVIVFMGDGSNYYKNLIKNASRESDKIFMHELAGSDVYMENISSADFGIHLMEKTCLNHEYALPNKFFEYIMAGLPVIISDLYEMKKIVKEKDVGMIVKKNNSVELIRVLEKIRYLPEDKFKKNLIELSKIYNWENEEKKLIKLYNSLL